jgi:rubrerythrin
MGKQVRVYSARDAMQAEFLVQVLASHGIEAFVTGAALANIVGYLPGNMTAPFVTVDEADADRARPLVDDFERSGRGFTRAPDPAGSWTCPRCGEHIEGQFTDCWSCQTPRDGAVADESCETAAELVSRLREEPPPPSPSPPDPMLNVDLRCLRCDYNLRGLPIDGVCPECAYPAAASLLQTMQSQQEWSMDVGRELSPCLEYLEGHFGFPMEAAVFVLRHWPRATALARSHDLYGEGADEYASELLVALRDLAAEFFGDPLTAARAMRRWTLATPRDLRRVTDVLAELKLIQPIP